MTVIRCGGITHEVAGDRIVVLAGDSEDELYQAGVLWTAPHHTDEMVKRLEGTGGGGIPPAPPERTDPPEPPRLPEPLPEDFSWFTRAGM